MRKSQFWSAVIFGLGLALGFAIYHFFSKQIAGLLQGSPFAQQ